MRDLVIQEIQRYRFFSVKFLQSLSDARLLELYEQRKM